MNVSERQNRLISGLSTVVDRSGVVRILHELRDAFSFRDVTLMSMPGTQERHIGPHIIETSLPETLIREFDRDELLRDSPIFTRLRNSILPQGWHLERKDDERELSLPGELLMRKYEMITGLSVPLTSVDGSRYIISYSGTRDRVGMQETNLLLVSSMQVFDNYDRIRRREIAMPNPLSARELEVLKWTAQGKTSVEIGHILTLSDHTVNAYLTNAIRKLDCVNRTQLVAKALRLKLIA